MTKQEITNSINASDEFYIHTLESEIFRRRSLQYECLNDDDLFYFVSASQILTQFQRITALNALALEGDREKIYHACLYDPLTSAVCSMAEVREMVDSMFQSQAQWLPQFK